MAAQRLVINHAEGFDVGQTSATSTPPSECGEPMLEEGQRTGNS